MLQMNEQQPPTPNQNPTRQTRSLTLQLNPWWLCAALAAVLLVAIVLWRPWQDKAAGDRTIKVSGQATVKAEPDEYRFSPSYEFRNTDKDSGLKEMTAKSDEVIAGIKKLGVADKDIESNASGYRDYYYFNRSTNSHTYNLDIQITAGSRDKAQKIQDYLLTTGPTGSVSPSVTFSDSKRKELESKGRDQATREARAKADQQASNLGFKIGKVKAISDSNTNMGWDGGEPMITQGLNASGNQEKMRLDVQPGENELTYSVEVVYYIR